MSDFRGHLQAGLVTAGVCVALLLSLSVAGARWFAYQELPVIFGVALLGALWPDTDIGSKSRQWVYLFFVILDVCFIFILGLIAEAALLGLFTMLPALSKHRGFTHSFRANLLVGLLWLLLPAVGTGFLVQTVKIHHYRDFIFTGVPYYLAFLMGVGSHLILDRHPYFKRRRSASFRKAGIVNPSKKRG